MAENKVQFGVSNLHFGTYDVSDAGVVTLGTPFHLPGTTQITLDAESEENKFYKGSDRLLFKRYALC